MSDSRNQPDRRALPNDLAAERGVLGGVLSHGADVLAGLATTLGPGDFYDRRHGAIFAAMCDLYDKGAPVDEITVTSRLSDVGQLERVGGAAYLAELADIILSPAHAEHYAHLVRDKATMRDLIAAAQKVQDMAFLGSQPPDQTVAQAQTIINRISQGATLGELKSTAEVLGTVWTAYQDRHEQKGRDDRAIPTGWPSLDLILGGLRPGKLIVPAGRPGMGKTSWMLNLAADVALRQGKTVLFATKEQPPTEMVDWLVCCQGLVNTTAWASGRTTPVEHRSAEARRDALARAPLYWLRVRERGERALRSIAANARFLQASKGLSLVIADYIQIMAQTRTKHEHISEISFGLKELALELDVPVVAASQLGRQVEERDPPVPKMSDLKGSGSIEEDADVVLLLYRPAYYTKASDDQTVQIGVDKQRGGATGRVDLMFDAQLVRFWDPRDQAREPQKRMF